MILSLAKHSAHIRGFIDLGHIYLRNVSIWMIQALEVEWNYTNAT